MDNLKKFLLQVFKAHKEFVSENWEKWQVYVADTLKADVEKNYPDGFKTFLVERLDEEIKTHSKTK